MIEKGKDIYRKIVDIYNHEITIESVLCRGKRNPADRRKNVFKAVNVYDRITCIGIGEENKQTRESPIDILSGGGSRTLMDHA
jgi:hypothetical protein